MSSGSVSSGILSSREDPRGRCTLEAAWLNRPIMAVIGRVGGRWTRRIGGGRSVDQRGSIYGLADMCDYYSEAVHAGAGGHSVRDGVHD